MIFGLLASFWSVSRRTQGRTPFHPRAVLPRPAPRTQPLPATPFQCPRSRTATLPWWVLSWGWRRPFWFSKKISCSSPPLSGLSRIKVDVLRSWSSPYIYAVPSATGNMKILPFIGVNTSFALSLRAWSSDASICSNSSMSATSAERIRGTIQVRLSFQTDGLLTDLSQRLGTTQPVNQTEWSVL